MKSNNLKRYWYGISHELKERWPDITPSDLEYVHGDVERLREVVQKRRHISEEEARQDVQFFLEHLEVRQRMASLH